MKDRYFQSLWLDAHRRCSYDSKFVVVWPPRTVEKPPTRNHPPKARTTRGRRCNFIMLPDQAPDPESHPKSSDDFKIAEQHWQGRAKTRFETCAHISLKEQPTGPGGTYPDPWDNACPIPADGDYASMNACAPVSKTKGHTTERSDRDVFLSQALLNLLLIQPFLIHTC